ncbi:acetyltransferase [Candidatus Phyllobacterium onerii]|uniref:acetyltransferase n=1 Tax=Candidatus Phyllobacterium onerii TaxID=3020828 RepID=UPI00232CF2CA|nr:acetyltransferase [Phyllobacterium sp. IY22]
MMISKAIIYGAGGHARELHFQLQAEGASVLAFIDDFRSGFDLDSTPVLSRDDARIRFPDANWYIAIGNIAGRKTVLKKLRDLGLTVGSFISSRALISPSATICGAAQIFANTVVSSGVRLADNVIVNFGSVISHDVRIGSNSFLAANVTIAGHVDVGDDVWLGAGSVVRNGTSGNPLRIGNRVTVGASACVVGDVVDGYTVIGVPAKKKD